MTMPSPPLSPNLAQATREARDALERLARPAGSVDASRYFRGADGLGFYNIGTDRVRAMAREIARSNQQAWSVDEACAFAGALIADRHLDYSRQVLASLTAAGIRADLDERQEKIGYKIREAQLQKIPYMLVVGDREAAEGTVAVRTRTGGDQGAQAVSAFVDAALEEVKRKGRDAH